MARIAGVDLPRNKRTNIALTYIYGIGTSRAATILDAANVDPMKKISDLGEDEVNRIRQVIEAQGSVEGDLRKDVSMNIKRLIEIGSYRGFRHYGIGTSRAATILDAANVDPMKKISDLGEDEVRNLLHGI